jgi:hypothetical protein
MQHQWGEIIRVNGKKYVELVKAERKLEVLREALESIIHDFDHYGNVSKGLKLEIDHARKLI